MDGSRNYTALFDLFRFAHIYNDQLLIRLEFFPELWNRYPLSRHVTTSCSIVAQMIAAGKFHRPGVWAPEDTVTADLLFKECRLRGMKFSRSTRSR
jgi:saccharopine dehydrogenase-like NADP-dependent oxidoreductase